MKGIIIEDCLNCPFSDFKNVEDHGGILVCELGKDINCKTEELCRMDKGDYTTPDWCRLENLQDIIEIAALDYGVFYKGKRK